MEKTNIALIGLGRVGSVFLKALTSHSGETFRIVAVAESRPTPGYEAAIQAGIPVYPLVDLIAHCPEIDVLFDLTGSNEVRHTLRDALAAQRNQRTVIAPESVARILWAFIGDAQDLPDIHAATGY